MGGLSRDEVIRMAQECQLIGMRPHLDGIYQQSLERFAALVAAAEREACASIEVKVITPVRDYTDMSPLDTYEAALMDAAVAFRAAIRARGNDAA